MPPGAPHHSFLVPYRIRVDNFSTPKDPSFETPALYLLSHTHSDHITGLSAKSFGARVICSIDAKHMLLNAEPAADRIAFDKREKSEKTRPHSHLKIDPVLSADGTWKRTCSRDLLRAVPLNTPTLIEISDGVAVKITLIDANHCPGAVMFLVEGPHGNFLHTGDVRAEPSFLAALARNSWLERYIPPVTSFFNPANAIGEQPLRTLDAIYLDTACLISHKEVPSKEEACSGLVELISLFPPLTRFFINSWTWGYEDILKAIGRAFNSQIHVDRYKHDIYTGTSDPFLKALITLDHASTRFHACERWNRCENVENYAIGVVYINPVTMTKVQWDLYSNETRAQLERGEVVTNLLCPLSRHSHLPELQALVKLFKPKLVVPNSLNPTLGNLDWACMPRMFGEFMADGGETAIRADMRRAGVNVDGLEDVVPALDAIEPGGVEMDNLVGEGAADLVRQWTGGGTGGGDTVLGAAGTKDQRMMAQMAPYLGQRGVQMLADHLKDYALRRGIGSDSQDSDGDDEAEADARGKAAENFFAPTSPISARSSLGRARGPFSSPLFQSSISPKPRHSTPDRRTSPQKSSPGSGKRFTISSLSMSSPFGPGVSPLSIVSLSPPFHISPGSSDERAYHSLFDALQFQSKSPGSVFPPLGVRKELHRLNTVALTAPRANSGLLGPPCPVSTPSSKQNSISRIPQPPFASPSVTPSPPQPPLQHTPTLYSKAAVPPTPVSGPAVVIQKATRHPPMLDLCKMLKRTSTVAGLSRPPAKRRSLQVAKANVSSSPPPAIEHKTALQFAAPGPSVEGSRLVPPRDAAQTSTGTIPGAAPRATSLNRADATQTAAPAPSAPSPALPQSPRSDAEMERRRRANEKKRQIRVKLIRALPPDKVSPAFKVKVERRERELAECRSRQKVTVIAARQRVYGRDEANACLSQPLQLDEPQGSTNRVQKERTLVHEHMEMDWNRSREYEDGINGQRSEGIHYPRLPRSEKSFIESQSP